MKIKIEIDMDNAAFGDDRWERGSTAAYILNAYLREIDYDGLDAGDSGTLKDCNGNTVDRWEVTE